MPRPWWGTFWGAAGWAECACRQRVFFFSSEIWCGGAAGYSGQTNSEKNTGAGGDENRRQIRISQGSAKIHAPESHRQRRLAAPDSDSIISPRWPPRFWGMGRGSRGSSHMTTVPPTPTYPTNTLEEKTAENSGPSRQRRLRSENSVAPDFCRARCAASDDVSLHTAKGRPAQYPTG